MNTQDFKENQQAQTEQPEMVDMNTDENIAGTQNLNEPVAEEYLPVPIHRHSRRQRMI